MSKLTKAQMNALRRARSGGGIIGFGIHVQVIDRLRNIGLLSHGKDRLGYYTITDAGRAVLEKEG